MHYRDTGHAFSLELATLRIWDYAADGFVQREDFLKCPNVRGFLPFNRDALPYRGGSCMESSQVTCNKGDSSNDHHNDSHDQGLHPSSTPPGIHHQHPMHADIDETSPKKAIMIGEEYEALLQSALEDQAQHYEGELSLLRAELTAEQIDAKTISREDISEIETLQNAIADLRRDISRMGKQLLDVQAQEAGYRATCQRLLREQADSKEILDKLREETVQQHQLGKMEVEELEQQIVDLTTNLKMRQQISQDRELSNAQIFATSRKPSAKRSGKKSRRFNRRS